MFYSLMLIIDLIGPTLANSNIKQMQSWQVANPLKSKVIKSQDKENKLKDNDPRHMRSKS